MLNLLSESLTAAPFVGCLVISVSHMPFQCSWIAARSTKRQSTNWGGPYSAKLFSSLNQPFFFRCWKEADLFLFLIDQINWYAAAQLPLE
jgi:hypothetical protein